MLQNGQNTINLTVRDAHGASARKQISVDKKLGKLWYTFTRQLLGDGKTKPTHIVVTPSWTIAKGAEGKIEVCNNANDSSPTWELLKGEDAHVFANSVKTADKWAIGVRVTIERKKATEISTLRGFGGAYK